MLTKELLCFRTNKGKILPKLIEPEAPKLLRIANELVAAFSESVGEVRETLEWRTKQVLDRYPLNALVGRGLEKLLLDRTEFDTEAKMELTKLREKIFSSTAALLSGKEEIRLSGFEMGVDVDLESYQREVARSMGISVEKLSVEISMH